MKLRDFYENTKDTLSAIIKIYNKDYIEIHEGNITSLEALEDVILDTEINDMYIGYDYTLAIVLDSFDVISVRTLVILVMSQDTPRIITYVK